MPRIKLSADLKRAITELSGREKDKYLHRLIAKEPLLVDQLTFRLLENSETTEERRDAVREEIQNTLRERVNRMRSIRYLLRDIRKQSGNITRHLKTTKDTYGELELNFCLLNETFELMGDKIRQFSDRKSRSFDMYMIRKAGKLLKLMAKIHPDYRLDFMQDLKDLHQHFNKQRNIKNMAVEMYFDLDQLADPDSYFENEDEEI